MKEMIIKLLSKNTKLEEQEISALIEIPKDSKMGDYSLPCFSLAKKFKKGPAEIAQNIANNLKNLFEFEKVEAINGYVNLFINRIVLAENAIKEIRKHKEKYGSNKIGKGKKILIEFSSPNIAKPFGIGHLRSTIIGNSIANISEFCGFKTIRMNYLGDWGTQFGILIAGYKKYGSLAKLQKDPIHHLQDIYVKANDDETLKLIAREHFRKLELGDHEEYELWRIFKSYSIKEFEKIYNQLNIKFDAVTGESMYNKKMEEIVQELRKKNLLKESEGAQIVDLTKYNLGIALIKKSDGTTLYATRDLAAAIARYNKYKFDSMIYEVGSEQTLHFKQIFKILELLGNKWAKNCIHAAHGLYLDKDGKKFATRKGKTIFMEDILNEATELARREVKKRETTSKEENEKRARAIALAAIIYGDLKNYRINDIVFDIERFTSFEGDTGPYLLYSYARAKSILRKADYKKAKFKIEKLTDAEKSLLLELSKFPEVVISAYYSLSPNLIANYAFQLAQNFNEFYHSTLVIKSENEQFRLALVDSFSQVLKNALSLLGISVLEKM